MKGFDPSCPKCVADEGISGIVKHLNRCATQNEADVKAGAGWSRPVGVIGPDAVAKEQRRMIAILTLYQTVSKANHD